MIDIISSFMVFLVLVAFLTTWALNRISVLRIRKRVRKTQDIKEIMQRTLDKSSNIVLKLDLRTKYGTNLHGTLLPEEGMSYKESLRYIHPEDRHIYEEFVGRLYHGETKTDECTFRWNRNYSRDEECGVKSEDWRWLHNRGVAELGKGEGQPPTTIFCTMTDETDRLNKESEEAKLTDRYRRMFDGSIIGLAFFDKDFQLLTANQKMREILKFQGEKDPYYYGKKLYELPTFQDLIRNKEVEELHFCTKSIVIERGVNCYMELRVHPIYDEKGELFYITLTIRDVTQERELYLQNKRNERDMRRANEAIEQYETELQYLMDTCNMRFFRTSFSKRECYFFKSLGMPEKVMSFDELIAHFIDSPFRQGLMEPENYFNVPQTTVTKMHPFFHEGEDLQWNHIDSVPYFDEHGQLEGSYGIVRNVTELIEKQERLKEETERANDSGRLKSVFMANMTHEIRTPLNSIVGFSDVLPMLSTPEEKQEIVRVIMNNCDMLLRLINDILAISTLDTGGIHIEPKAVDFAKAFDDICESLKERVQTPGVEFVKENPYRTLETVVDNGRLQQVITNFVTNAVKYTHQGHIKVGYRCEPGTDTDEQGLYIYCEDTGEGIPKEAQKKIFERFVKLNDYIQGTGLGLSICKAIADSCKGKIGVISEGKDKGSTFWIWIPADIKMI